MHKSRPVCQDVRSSVTKGASPGILTQDSFSTVLIGIRALNTSHFHHQRKLHWSTRRYHWYSCWPAIFVITSSRYSLLGLHNYCMTVCVPTGLSCMNLLERKITIYEMILPPTVGTHSWHPCALLLIKVHSPARVHNPSSSFWSNLHDQIIVFIGIWHLIPLQLLPDLNTCLFACGHE